MSPYIHDGYIESNNESENENDFGSYLKRGGTKKSFVLGAVRIFVVLGGASLLGTAFVSESSMQRVNSAFVRKSKVPAAPVAAIMDIDTDTVNPSLAKKK